MTNKDIVKGFFIEAYQNGNCDFIMQYFSDTYYDHSPAAARSNADAAGIIKIVHTMFSDLKLTIFDLFEENGMVATRIQFEGTHIGECLGIPATGKRITWEALENFKVVDGKVVESWGYWPDLQMKEMLLR